ncbi:MAG: 16S rRNA (cytidine(1402)-2'-O)-methyltransferase, partial [Myxococcota bacterium]
STPFHFLGFPPRKAGAVRKMIEDASHLEGPFVLLESGRRVGALIAVLAELLPGREAVMCRELTKQYEEITRGDLTAMSTEPQRGEVVLVVGPGQPVVGSEVEVGPDLKTIASALAERWECSKRDAYNALLALENDRK